VVFLNCSDCVVFLNCSDCVVFKALFIVGTWIRRVWRYQRGNQNP
jgi:hypothetical protein